MPILKLVEKLSGRQDVILAVFIVSVTFMLIIPLPTTLVDVLIALNISISVILLMIAVYLRTPLDFAAFPAVLLITTLFRLALSISTTRLILLQADAGKIVETFGNFVVGGNLVVGLVIFLILTIVQFIVITKGAERVAEVSARFSLDALPGKQLSIDADMRAGSIDLDEARRARARLQKESKLYGSMDGAMKFVKGDAIAGVIIVFVNLLGGLAIGMLQRDLTFGEAISVYSTLTIGDGLIGQIPALFISITAGIIVTRVADDSEDVNLGTDIGRQLGNEPRALLVAAAMLLVFAAIPGFPSFVFLSLAAALGLPGLLSQYFARRKARAEAEEDAPLERVQPPQPMEVNGSGGSGFSAARDEIFFPTASILLEIAEPALPKLGSPAAIKREINQARLSVYYRLGVNMPVIDVRANPGLPDAFYRIHIEEIPASEGEWREGELMVLDRKENLDLYQIAYEEREGFLPGSPIYWVKQDLRAQLQEAGIVHKTALEAIAYHCESVLGKYSQHFLGVEETRRLLGHMEALQPELTKEVQRVVPIQTLAELLRRLIQEYVSIRNLRRIFGTIVEWGAKEKDPVLLVEHIRAGLARQISYQYAADNNILLALLLDGEIEEAVRNAVRQTSGGSYLALDAEISNKIVARIRSEVDASLAPDNPLVLITALDVRRYVRRMIETEIPELPVMSFQEVAAEITLQPLARISLAG